MICSWLFDCCARIDQRKITSCLGFKNHEHTLIMMWIETKLTKLCAVSVLGISKYNTYSM